MLNWFRELLRIVRNHKSEMFALHSKVVEVAELVKDRTSIAVDVGYRTNSFVIVVGRYKNRDYVQTFSVSPANMCSLIEYLREQERFGEVVQIDAMPLFKAVFEKEVHRVG